MSAFIWPFIILSFSTWAVSLGGIATLQQQCSSSLFFNSGSEYDNVVPLELAYVNGFSGNITGTGFSMTCKTAYRFQWFTVALQFVVVVLAAAFLATGMFARSRMGIVGLLSVVTMLYIFMTDSFLTAGSLPSFQFGNSRTRERVMLAGSLMTAAANCFLIIVAGVEMDGKSE